MAAIAEESARQGHHTSAHEAFMRAATYFRTAYQPLFGAPVDPRLAAAFADEQESAARAAANAPFPLEPVEIPLGELSMPGWHARVDDTGEPRPTVVHTNGYDSNVAEMMAAHVPPAIRRGYDMLLFDGPGQGRCLVRDGVPIRPDWEAVVTPAVDAALARPGVDPDRIVLAGWSFGGFLAPRAAAFEHRIAALVADPGQWDQRDALVAHLPIPDAAKAAFPDVDPSVLDPMVAWLEGPDGDPGLRWRLLRRGPWVHGTGTLFEALAALSAFEVSSVAEHIACPTLVTQAEGDPSAAGASRLIEAVSGSPKVLVPFTAAEGGQGHCEGAARALYHQRVYDWLDEVLAGD